jgi:hypothetical protein
MPRNEKGRNEKGKNDLAKLIDLALKQYPKPLNHLET